MEWLNYHHLLYFWTVAREGSVSKASRVLRLAQPTISGQLRSLEHSLDQKLFERVGRNLVLTDVGRVVYRYADEIFGLGRELMDTVKGRGSGRPLELTVGIADQVPKVVAHRLLEPARRLGEPVTLVCHEDKPERLLASLALHELDIVFSDAPAGSATRVRAFSHLLGDTGITFFAAPDLAAKARRGFPRSLASLPVLLPTRNTTLRRSLDAFFQAAGIEPRVVAEFEDSALLKVFGGAGEGCFPAPTVMEKEIRRQFGVRAIGEAEGVSERFYALSVERKIKHPAVLAITEAARERLFA
ncbi:Transcriptional activator protein NhaR [Myxococcaceae bacterium]|jgi:LysR family transcriptional activator of nhaA|nr:Transcriptional activator protein NhaR [Myxococcaceae bacterium]